MIRLNNQSDPHIISRLKIAYDKALELKNNEFHNVEIVKYEFRNGEAVSDNFTSPEETFISFECFDGTIEEILNRKNKKWKIVNTNKYLAFIKLLNQELQRDEIKSNFGIIECGGHYRLAPIFGGSSF